MAVVTVENLEGLIRQGLPRLGVDGLDEGLPGRLAAYAQELLKWNERVNLTAITEPGQVVEKHLLDSLAALPELDATGARRVLDLGAGAGLPGLVWALARPALELTLVDAVAKKVSFMKATAARLGLAPRVRAVHLHLRGAPDAEGLPRAELVASRAFMDLEAWLAMASPYVTSDGVILAMTGRHASEAEYQRVSAVSRCRRVSVRQFHLPLSGDERGVSVWRREAGLGPG